MSIVTDFKDKLTRQLEDANDGLKIALQRLEANKDYQDYKACQAKVAELEQALKDLEPKQVSCSCMNQRMYQLQMGQGGTGGLREQLDYITGGLRGY